MFNKYHNGNESLKFVSHVQGTSFMDCVDINECIEKPNICQNGECKNLQGSFQCICQVGYLLTSTRDNCIDIDECQRHPNICNNGKYCLLYFHYILCLNY